MAVVRPAAPEMQRERSIRSTVSRGADPEMQREHSIGLRQRRSQRTDAALRGFYTRTEDEAKVKQWDASLKPKRGFLEGSSVYSDEVVAERRRREARVNTAIFRKYDTNRSGKLEPDQVKSLLTDSSDPTFLSSSPEGKTILSTGRGTLRAFAMLSRSSVGVG